MLPQLKNESEVMQRCQSGDLTAYHRIYETFNQTFLLVALRMLGNQQDAEDAVQVTFIKFHRSVKSFRFRSGLGTYLMRILLRVCFDSIRQRRRFQFEAIEEQQNWQPVAANPNSDLKLDLQQALTKLPERMRATFVLFAVEGLKQQEVAEILGISIGGVKSNIFHAKARLRQFLAEREAK